jgi:hypothetical protein
MSRAVGIGHGAGQIAYLRQRVGDQQLQVDKSKRLQVRGDDIRS